MNAQQNDKTLEHPRWETKVGIQQDNKIVGDLRREIKVGIAASIKVGTGTGTKQDNKKGEDWK